MKIIKISAIWCPACIITNNAFNKLKDNYNFELEELDYDFDDVEEYKVGDILRIDNNTHSVVVMKVVGSNVVLAEGNYSGTIHWGRMITKTELTKTLNYVLTRY